MVKIKLLYGIAFALTTLSNYPAQAQLMESTGNRSESIAVEFKEPDYSGDAPSGRRRGTGSRGDCPMAVSETGGNLRVTPVIHKDSRGWTVNEFPTIWVHVSYESESVERVLYGEFSLQDLTTQTKLAPKYLPVTLPSRSGVFSIPLPYSLEVGKWYRWYLILDCNSPDSFDNDSFLFIEGFLKRVELPEFKHQLDNKTSQKLITVYAKNGIWYDALNESAKLRCSNPQNSTFTEAWFRLLKVVELEEIAQESLICRESLSLTTRE
ncbi:DUF928 domain-containing protein [Moorena producens]|uniref:DUF928 domain-containing protein n=1 Tax=Moorena producens TaxID=1155739 RepID=UPI003C71F5F8